ncbi:hypothetical protein ACOTVS_11755 [Aliarcobacter butzleri]|uniref:hypothetical protein n=1 Tax=Aliarcobacter butzleri TaxID=28197 RepID=UPI00344ED45F
MKSNKLEISKNLLSKITKIPEQYIKKIDIGVSIIKVTKTNDTFEEHNIYEFLNNCKSFVISSGFGISSSEDEKGLSVKLSISGLVIKEFPPTIPEEAILNYCEWVLNYKKDSLVSELNRSAS